MKELLLCSGEGKLDLGGELKKEKEKTIYLGHLFALKPKALSTAFDNFQLRKPSLKDPVLCPQCSVTL